MQSSRPRIPLHFSLPTTPCRVTIGKTRRPRTSPPNDFSPAKSTHACVSAPLTTMDTKTIHVLREPAEIRFAAELETLARLDESAKPRGWRLSPRAVRTFILGSGDDHATTQNNGELP